MIRTTKWLLWGVMIAVTAQMVAQGVAIADSVRDAQWHLSFLGIRNAQLVSRGEGVAVALVDTGVDASHPDLGDSIGTGLEVEGSGNGHVDADGHGTSMAGLVAARGRTSSSGALGIASASLVIPIKIPNQRPLTVATAIDRAIEQGAKVICLALTTSDDRELELAVRRAQAADIVIVAGAGNFPDVGVQPPATYAGVVVAVGIDRDGKRADISVSGSEALLAAPAVGIVSTAPGAGYSEITGTSPATAIIAGVAALVRSKYPELSAAEVINRMTSTAIDKGTPGRDKEYGFGIVDPVSALTANVPPLGVGLSASPSLTGPLGESKSPDSEGGVPVIGFVALVVGLAVAVAGVVLLSRRARR